MHQLELTRPRTEPYLVQVRNDSGTVQLFISADLVLKSLTYWVSA